MMIALYCVLLFLTLRIPTKHALHMFQQNRYENGRYGKWLKENLKDAPEKSVIPLAILLVALVLNIFVKNLIPFMVIAVVLAVYDACMEKGKTYIKPLVYTARVKRQIGVTVILDAIVISLIVNVMPLNGFFGLVFANLCAWIMIFPMGWITAPVEHMFQQRYLKEAKNILESYSRMTKIGITGSYGKTTTKNIMQAVLSEQFNSLMTPASFNTPMGITRTVRELLKPIHEVFVCEMGADHVGDIEELMNFVHPSIGVVTSVGPQHLNTFGSQENITREKMKMIEMLPKDGFGIINVDNVFIRDYAIQNSVEVVTYGIANPKAMYRADEITYTQTGSSFTVVHGEERERIETKLLGELNILNILSAIACARHLGVDWETIRRACRTMKQVEHRLELKKINGYRFIDDAFNANPSGSAMALQVLSGMPGRRIIVTPGMIDLGEKQAEINKEFGKKMKGLTDTVVLVGETQTKPIFEGLKESGFDMQEVHVMNTVKEAFAYVWQNATPEDTILLENDLPDAFNH